MNDSMVSLLKTLVGRSVNIITDNTTISLLKLESVSTKHNIILGYTENAKIVYVIDMSKVIGFSTDMTNVADIVRAESASDDKNESS